MIGAKIANMERTDTLKQGSRSANLPNGKISQPEAAKMLNVNKRTLSSDNQYKIGSANLPTHSVSQPEAAKMLNVSVVTHQVANLHLDIEPFANLQKVSQPEAAKMLSIKSLVFHFYVSI